MNTQAYVHKLHRKWVFYRWIQALALWSAFTLIILVLIADGNRQLLMIILSGLVSVTIYSPWKINLKRILRHLDITFPEIEYSSSLLAADQEHLQGLALVQKKRIEEVIRNNRKITKPPVKFWPSILFIVISAFIFGYRGPVQTRIVEKSNSISLAPAPGSEATAPIQIDHAFQIDPPSYTGLKSFSSASRVISAPEGSRITWKVASGQILSSARLSINSDTTVFEEPSKEFGTSFFLNQYSLSRFSLFSEDSIRYNSEIMELKMIPDESPAISVSNQDEFTRFTWNEPKKVSFNIQLEDDYGLSDAAIVATVSQGSGESVKFRELRIPFDGFTKGVKNLRTLESFDLDEMKLEPGDELYFYIEAADNRVPDKNITRSSTYFIQISDTSSYEFSLEGDLGADIMPEYFRSQRQIIIDTEKLISEQNNLAVQAFNSTSNELGFDQKALRLRYGQFLGEEDESGIVVSEEAREPTTESYTHDHDNEDSGGDDPAPDEDTDMLDEYLHDHGDPEEATFFKVSLRTKLKQAMAEMWDAELYLRLFQPDKSLPYQYRALELIREIKNDSRIYVHRIGFEPPPIKDENRLSGKLEEVRPVQRSQTIQADQHLSELMNGLEQLETYNDPSRLAETLQLLYRELSSLAIEQPLQYLGSLQKTDSLLRMDDFNDAALTDLKHSILEALPEQLSPVVAPDQKPSSLTEALRKGLR